MTVEPGASSYESSTQNGVTSYSYTSWIGSLSVAAATISVASDELDFTYDASGNVLSKGTFNFTYNHAGRMVGAEQGTMTASYLYTALGERVAKVVNGATTRYHYDQAGQLLAVSDAAGNVIQEYVYLDGRRLALVDSNQVYYLHTNHLDTPIAITDNTGIVQWKGHYDAYGNLISEDVNNLNQALRFPGQVYDDETGLYYNYFRDYDPEIGRYVQSDPIGLAGGLNTFGYVGGNPVSFVDPMGEIAHCFAWPLGTASCGVTAVNAGYRSYRAYRAAQSILVLDSAINDALENTQSTTQSMSIPSLMSNELVQCEDDSSDDENNHCDYQYYEVDTPTCNSITRIRGASAGQACHASAAERYAACLAGRPKPPLNTWNN